MEDKQGYPNNSMPPLTVEQARKNAEASRNENQSGSFRGLPLHSLPFVEEALGNPPRGMGIK